MRLFFGTLLDASNQAFYGELAADLRRRHAALIRPVPTGTVHLTYVFLPNVPDNALSLVRGLAETSLSSHSPIAIAIGPPRVLWAGRTPRLIEAPVVEGARELGRLVASLSGALKRGADAVEHQASKAPHVTLARFPKHASRAEGERVAVTLAGDGRRDSVDRVALIASTLTSDGPLYEVVVEFRLG